MRRLFSVAATFSAIILFSIPTPAKTTTSRAIDDLVSSFAKRDFFYGVVLAEENGRITFEKAYGMANLELDVPNRTDTRIGIASITKPMTDIILFRLIQEQKITLEDTVASFLPDFPDGDKITVSMLAHHRSGIPHRVMPPEQESVPQSTSDMVEWIAKAILEFEPGSQRSYSSAGYSLLARLLELASGQTYTELLDRYVFEPARMKDSLEFDAARIIQGRAQEYVLTPDGPRNAPAKDYSFLVGAGSVLGTARDLYRFASALLAGTYGESAKRALAPEGVFRSSGRTNGHRAYLQFDNGTHSGFVLLSNLSSGAFDIISARLNDILVGKRDFEKFRFPKLVTNSKRDLSEFVGTYDRKSGGAFQIVLKDGVLHSGDIGIYPTTKEDCFFDFSFFGEVCFGRDESGAVESIDWKGADFELVGIKKDTN